MSRKPSCSSLSSNFARYLTSKTNINRAVLGLLLVAFATLFGASRPAIASDVQGPMALDSYATNIQGAPRVVLSWKPVAGASGYVVKRSLSYSGTYATIGTSSSTSFVDQNVFLGTAYYYSVSPYNSQGEGAASFPTCSTVRFVPEVGGVEATAFDSQVVVQWQAVQQAEQYFVFRSDSYTSSWSRVAVAPEAMTAFIDKSVTNGRIYYYSVVAVMGHPLDPAYSDATPASVSPSPYAFKARFFPPFGNADSVLGGRFQGSNDFSEWTDLAIVDQQPADDAWSELALGAQLYRYLRYVAPQNTDEVLGELEFYNGASRLNGPGFGTPGGYGTVANAFERALDGDTSTSFQAAGGGAFVGIDSGATGGSVSGQSLRSSASVSSRSGNVSIMSGGAAPAAPTISGVSASNASVTVSWDAVSDATQYKVQRSPGNSQFADLGTTTSLSYMDTTCANGSKYWYRVCAINENGSSAYSSNVTAVPSASYPAPVDLYPYPSSAQVKLIWGASAGAVSYKVKRLTTYESSSSTNYQTIATISATLPTYTDTSVSNGTTYYYVVSAVNASGTETFNSNVATVTPNTAMSAPQALRGNALNGGVSLFWDGVPGATKYNVYKATSSGGPYTLVLTTAAPTTSLTPNGLTNNTTYYFIVKAAIGSTETSASNEVALTPQDPPPAPFVVATSGDKKVTLTWDAAPRATSYSLFKASAPGGPYTSAGVIQAPTTTATFNNLTNGTTYYYKVQSLSTSFGAGGESSEVSATPMAPLAAPVLSGTAGDAAAQLSWTTITGASGYRLKRATTAGGPYSPVATITGTSYSDSGLTNGTAYYYIVNSLNGQVESLNSNQVAVTPKPVISTLSIAPATVIGGNSSQGTITLTGSAPAEGIVVNLSSDNASAAVAPSVTVPAGATSVTFTISTSAVTASSNVIISATSGNVTLTATLTVSPPTVVALSLSPSVVDGGANSEGTITLSGAAPQGGQVVSLSSNNPKATCPTSVTVAAGQTSATFTVTTSTVAPATCATITASANGTSATQTLSINAPCVYF